MGFLTRKPGIDEPHSAFPDTSNTWGSQNPDYDDVAVLLDRSGKRCCVCKKVILNRYLKYKDEKPYCPDCEPK